MKIKPDCKQDLLPEQRKGAKNMSEYRYTPQITSSNMRLKDGSNIVFAAEHTFPEYFLQDYLKEGASLELSGLDRFILRMNKKPKEGATISVDANLPMSNVTALGHYQNRFSRIQFSSQESITKLLHCTILLQSLKGRRRRTTKIIAFQ